MEESKYAYMRHIQSSKFKVQRSNLKYYFLNKYKIRIINKYKLLLICINLLNKTNINTHSTL